MSPEWIGIKNPLTGIVMPMLYTDEEIREVYEMAEKNREYWINQREREGDDKNGRLQDTL